MSTGTGFSEGVVVATMEHCCHRFRAAAVEESSAYVVPEVESDSEDDEVAFIAERATARETIDTDNEFLLHCPVSTLRQGDSGASNAPEFTHTEIPILQPAQPQPTSIMGPVQAIADSPSQIKLSKQPDCLLPHPPSSPPPALVQRTTPSSPPKLVVPGAGFSPTGARAGQVVHSNIDHDYW